MVKMSEFFLGGKHGTEVAFEFLNRVSRARVLVLLSL